MPDKIVLNTPRWTGEWEFDFEEEPLTALEWRWIKKVSGYLPLTVGDGMAGLDPDLFIAFAVIVLNRVGKIDRSEALAVAETLSDMPADGSALKVFFGDPEEADADGPPADPAVTPETEQPLRSIGPSSKPISDPLDPSRKGIGAHA